MRYLSSLKTMLRSPAKTLVTFVLLVATSFAFVSRGVEYTATVRQIDAAEASYSAVGTVQKTLQGYYDYMVEHVGEEVYELEDGVYLDRTDRAIVPLDDTVLDILAESEYIDVTEVRLVSGGTHSDLWVAFEQPLTDLEDYGSWKSADINGTFANYVVQYTMVADAFYDVAGFHGKIEHVLLAYPNIISESANAHGGSFMNGEVFNPDEPDYQQPSNVMDVICQYYARNATGKLDKSYPNEDYYAVLVEQLLPRHGEYRDPYYDDTLLIAAGPLPNSNAPSNPSYYRQPIPYVDYPIINLSYIEREYGETDVGKILEHSENYGCIRYTAPPSTKETESYSDYRGVDEEVGQMKVTDYLATVERNLHTSEVVYTSNMSLIPKVHGGTLFASSGRLLTSDDHDDVCVIGADFAEHNDLRVGDHITLDLCADTLVHSGKVFGRETPYPTDRDVIGENQLTERGLPNITKTFEIVGIWSDVDFDVEDPFTYSLNTIFVPADCYPWQGEVEPSALPSTLSFRLKHPGDMAAIETELGDKLAALGYELRIDDGGYAAAKPNLKFMKLSALIGFVGMSLALLLALILITYLFIIRKKKDYAIMRALGTPRSRANRSLLFGLLTLATVAIIIGAVAAGIVEQSSTAKMAADVAEITGDTSTGDGAWGLTALFGVGTLALVWLFARVGLAKISRTPPLELLQGSGR